MITTQTRYLLGQNDKNFVYGDNGNCTRLSSIAKKIVNESYRLEKLKYSRYDTTNFSFNNLYDPQTRQYSWRGEDSYQNQQYDRFINLYNDYMSELKNRDNYMAGLSDEEKYQNIKSSVMIAVERDFTSATGLTFTLDNLQKVKDSFEKDRSDTANMLIDTDILTAIKINKNGTFTLRFNSGREFVVDKLYKDTSKVFEARIELNLNINRLNEEELNTKLDFSVSAAKIRNSSGEIELISLKDLGVEMIKKLSSGGYKLFTDIQNNKSITVSDIYTKYIFGNSNLDNSDKSSNLNLNNSNSNKTINE
ncbi:TPA: hypothetical protein RPW15_001048 [Campylobacter fetus subsp. venerealis]|uniref:Uncharacterized protein n=7 Tax=Campylobacter fetus TaxID=196 RepID=A0AAE6J091_CAMFE|nr:hypothetical protein [Campylobacter fetus]OCS21980.1 hypothetical protein CFVI97532_06660 [Campylobacter fetus subsp. venerealis cfvi97/532]OCS26594.1 hypothetical protein CFVB10_03265 [Campylobacter fetus subsp. venerealis cfvB10]AHE94991.1 hypothetical protein CFVI03293_1726 [Campylobacter fetus subsp. venerealis cfvi03/293]AIR81412.1 hypothetical protein CFV97608_1829 [Campylobacter fetus subsp. venerealis 97/608]EAI3887179.1 hypothetical protein [Campylobacter fetus]